MISAEPVPKAGSARKRTVCPSGEPGRRCPLPAGPDPLASTAPPTASGRAPGGFLFRRRPTGRGTTIPPWTCCSQDVSGVGGCFRSQLVPDAVMATAFLAPGSASSIFLQPGATSAEGSGHCCSQGSEMEKREVRMPTPRHRRGMFPSRASAGRRTPGAAPRCFSPAATVQYQRSDPAGICRRWPWAMSPTAWNGGRS